MYKRQILTDPAGKVVYDTGKEMIGSSLAQRDYVQAALKGSHYWSPLFFSENLNGNCLLYALPVYSEGQSGHIVGTISIMLTDHIVGQVIREGLEATAVSYTHLDVYKRQPCITLVSGWALYRTLKSFRVTR